MLPGSDPVADTRARAGADFLAKLRRTYAEVPAPTPSPDQRPDQCTKRFSASRNARFST